MKSPQIIYGTAVFLIVVMLLAIQCTQSNSSIAGEVLGDVQSEISSAKDYVRGKRYSVLEVYYKDVLENNEDLQKLLADWKKIQEGVGGLNKDYAQFSHKVQSYYQEAEALAKGIKDSTLAKSVVAAIQQSEQLYEQKIAEVNDERSQCEQMEDAMQTQQIVLKVLLTLPYIEKYQAATDLQEAEYQAFLKKYGALLQTAKSLSDLKQ